VRPIYERLARTRPTYAFDLPGFGLSERSARAYTPRLMTDAIHAVVARIRDQHGGCPIDALALSLSCEFLARAATEADQAFRTLALVSPTGLDGRRRDGPAGSTRAIPGVERLLCGGPLGPWLFSQLRRPGVVRYFLKRTWGSPAIDEAMWAYDVATAEQPGAEYAPLAFLAGALFSKDVSRLYESLNVPVWVSHGVRGDFVDYRGAEQLASRAGWCVDTFATGALPHFEVPDEFFAAYERFLATPPSASIR
jgi:pimeloyl-ACP methyl ester carboxylesterase